MSGSPFVWLEVSHRENRRNALEMDRNALTLALVRGEC